MKSVSGALFVAMLLGAAGSARASVITISTQGAFSSLGTITQNENFDAYPDFTTVSNPFVLGDLTFLAESGTSFIGGTTPVLNNGFGLVRNLLTDESGSGFDTTTIQIAGTYNMFAVNAGNFFVAGDATFDITTNLGTYQFILPVPDGTQGLQFFGFLAGPGEYFTSVAFLGANTTGVTDVQLGISAVPEPGTLLLLGAGLAAVVARRRLVSRA